MLRACRRIAFYLSEDGEVDLGPAMTQAFRCRKQVFLPVLRAYPQRALWLCEFRPGDRLNRNRFGIGEPDHRHRRPVDPWGLDLVLMPLVGFDEDGNRLGMGGGFYDRTFAYRRLRRHWKKPKLIGVAHECQKVSLIEHRPWDVRVDGVVTEKAIYWLGRQGDPSPS